MNSLGIEVRLLTAAYIRPYVRRNQTDSTDACALIEAARNAQIHPVRVKSLEQQALQAMHRARSLWMSTQTSRINALRDLRREFGIAVPEGSRVGVACIARSLADDASGIPVMLRATMMALLDEIKALEARIAQLESELAAAARVNAACTQRLSIPGIGLLTATAMVAATSGDVTHFQSARHFASWFGLTPREYSSGTKRSLGGISRRGDVYLRMLLTHGARAVLHAATIAIRRASRLIRSRRGP